MQSLHIRLLTHISYNNHRVLLRRCMHKIFSFLWSHRIYIRMYFCIPICFLYILYIYIYHFLYTCLLMVAFILFLCFIYIKAACNMFFFLIWCGWCGRRRRRHFRECCVTRSFNKSTRMCTHSVDAYFRMNWQRNSVVVTKEVIAS